MKTQKPFSLLSWTLLTTAGFILGILLILLLAGILEGLNLDFQTPLGFISLSIGFLQWLLLRKYIEKSVNWVGFSFIAITSVFLMFDILHPVFKLDIQIYLFPLFVVGSLLSGYLQYRYLLRKVSDKAILWNLYNLAGWLACVLLLQVIQIHYFKTLGRNVDMYINLTAFILCGPMLVLITGIGIRKILSVKKEI